MILPWIRADVTLDQSRLKSAALVSQTIQLSKGYGHFLNTGYQSTLPVLHSTRIGGFWASIVFSNRSLEYQCSLTA